MLSRHCSSLRLSASCVPTLCLTQATQQFTRHVSSLNIAAPLLICRPEWQSRAACLVLHTFASGTWSLGKSAITIQSCEPWASQALLSSDVSSCFRQQCQPRNQARNNEEVVVPHRLSHGRHVRADQARHTAACSGCVLPPCLVHPRIQHTRLSVSS